MKTLVLLFLSGLVCSAQIAITGNARLTGNIFLGQTNPPAGGGGLAAFSDDFNRANSSALGANWSEDDPDLDIFSNTLRIVDGSGSYPPTLAIYNTATTTVNQYVQFTVATSGGYPVIALRYADASSAYYQIEFDATTAYWSHVASVGGTATAIANGAFSGIAAGEIVSVTITGTGTGTVIRLWKGMTSGSLPSAADIWAGDNTPDLSFTTDPASPVNTGNKVGLGGSQATANTEQLDNFYGGDVP